MSDGAVVPAVCVHDDGTEHPSDGTLPCQDALAGRIAQAILDRAPTWEVTFPAGPGQVVSVSDAALVAAKEVLRDL